MFFFSCLVPQMSQIMCRWHDRRCSLRHCSLVKCLKHPGSKQTASTEFNLAAMDITFIRVCKNRTAKFLEADMFPCFLKKEVIGNFNGK